MTNKALDALIRLSEYEVDERRRKLGQLLNLVATLENQLAILRSELGREQNAAASSPELAAFTYGNYAQTVIARRVWIQSSIAKAEEEVTAAREDLRDSYHELKRFEIGKDIRDEREAAALARLDQIDLDEIGLEAYRRRP